jgi:hypothetical protein
MIESNTWQTQVYAICDYDRVQYPNQGEWSALMNNWQLGKSARDSVRELLEMRKTDEKS